MDYQDYSKWKGWMSEVPFGELSAAQSETYRRQLERLGVPYKKVNALEIGYGNGAFLTFLQNHDSKVEGVEIQPGLLAAASAKGIAVQSSIDVVTGGPYDLIAAFDVLEHLTVEQLQVLFARCTTLLKQDGVMLFRFPNADSFAGMGAQNGDFTHITAIGQTKLHQIVVPFGFKIARFEGEIVHPQRPLVAAIRSVFRYLLMRAMGIGSPYFFSCNVVALVKFDERVTRAS